MLLGVYWYYGFPKDLYHFEFFAFRPGLGGHTDGPAELAATVHAPNPAALLAEVQAVAARYPEGYLFAQAHGARLRLELGGYALTDYSFHVATALEGVLRRQHAAPAAALLPADTPLLRLAAPHDPNPPYRYGLERLQAVSTGPGRQQAQVGLLRFDCHLPLARQAAFLAALAALCAQFDLGVLYYYDCPLAPQVNLMLFFGNGRQGVGGQPLRYTDTEMLNVAVLACLSAHQGQPRHLGDYPAGYPRRGPHIVRVVDAEFTL